MLNVRLTVKIAKEFKKGGQIDRLSLGIISCNYEKQIFRYFHVLFLQICYHWLIISYNLLCKAIC
jgi:hypothetical protein